MPFTVSAYGAAISKALLGMSETAVGSWALVRCEGHTSYQMPGKCLLQFPAPTASKRNSGTVPLPIADGIMQHLAGTG
jgi:hypothetical protein